MTGRQESSEKVENEIKKMLKNQPDVLSDWYYWMSDKTAQTKKLYIRIIIPMIKYLKECGINEYNFDKIEGKHINKYVNGDLKYYIDAHGNKIETSEGTINYKFFAIKLFFDYLLKENIIKFNPCNNVRIMHKTTEREIVAMTPDEIKIMEKNIINGVGSAKSRERNEKFISRNLSILYLGCNTGLRISSICEINLEDINMDNNSIVVREKGNKERTIYIGDKTKNIIAKCIRDRKRHYPFVETNALFISEKKQRLSPRTVNDIMKKYSVGIDKHITPHKMRSSCATNLYEATGDIYLVQNTLGHKSIANTMRYAKMSEKRRREATNILENL